MQKELTFDDVEHKLINKHALDEELVQQDHMFDLIATKLAYAISERDELKSRMEETYAERAKFYRECPSPGERVTEGKIAEQVELDPKYKIAKKKYEDSRRDAALWTAKKDAWLQRGHALRLLCDLYIANYYEKKETSAKSPREVNYQSAKKTLIEHRKLRKSEDESG